MTMPQPGMYARPLGDLLKEWRLRRRLTQVDLACITEIPTKRLAAMENGRDVPTQDMLLRIAERLRVPLREQNTMLLAAGMAPIFQALDSQQPGADGARQAINTVLATQEPNPACAIDRRWYVVAANRAFSAMIAGADPILTKPPINFVRLTLHPAGIALRIANLGQWRAYLESRLRRRIELRGDDFLSDLLEEIADYPTPPTRDDDPSVDGVYAGFAVPLRVETYAGTMSFLSTTTVFGTAVDILLSELTIESFLAADEGTKNILLRQAEPAN